MSRGKSLYGGLTRRSFLKTTGATAGVVALAGSTMGLATLMGQEEALAQGDGDETLYPTICRANCFQACMLNGHVRDGKLVKMSRYDYPEEIYSGSCLRGLSIPERVYSNHRVKYPMKQTGERGSDQWERISWDEALDEIAEKIKSIQTQYGNTALDIECASGTYGAVRMYAFRRLGTVMGSTIDNGCYDQAFGYGTNRVVGGGVWGYNNEPKTMVGAKNILIWGANPVNAQPQTWRIVQRAKEAGAKLICIDPMFSTTAAKCDEYIYVNPGSDLMIALAMVNEVIQKELIDEPYVKQYTSAPFLLRKDTGLILRRSDVEGGEMAGVRDAKTLTTKGSMKNDPAYVWDEVAGAPALYTECKTPVLEGSFTVNGIEVETVFTALKKHVSEYTIKDAASLSGMSQENIEMLIDIYAADDPVWLYSIYGIDHYTNGHLFGQAMAILHGLTNNLSKEHSSLGGLGACTGSLLPPGINTEFLRPPNTKNMAVSSISSNEMPNVIASGKHKGEAFPVKAMIVACSNPMSNFAQQGRWLNDVVPNLDLIVTCDFEMTDTARYSDYVLPISFWLESDDIRGNFSNPYTAYGHQAIDPLYESKTDEEIASILAEKLGYGDVIPMRTADEWIDIALNSDSLRALGITHETLREKNVIRCIGTDEMPQIIGYKGADLPTPSGRVELYCEFPLPRVDYGQDWKPQAAKEHFPIFTAPTENWPDSELKKKYPLSYIQSHERGRTHTQFFNVETLREIDKEPHVYISRADAAERGIESDEIVEVFNDRGHVIVKAIVTDACAPGVTYIPKGWQRDQFIEGCFQEMTSDTVDLMSVNYAFFDSLVDIRKWEG